jgi:hypothetical protein
MSFPHGPFSSPRAARTQPVQPRDKPPVFAVGQRAYASDPSGRKGPVVLIDVSGKLALGHLADGDEVEILAWIPRRGSTLYRVLSTEQRIEGWLGVANLGKSLAAPSSAAPASATTPVVWISPRLPTSLPTGTSQTKSIRRGSSSGLRS